MRYFAKAGNRTTKVYTDIYAINTATVKIDENIAYGKTNSAIISVPSSSSYDTWYDLGLVSDAAGSGFPIANMANSGNNKLTDGNYDARYGLWRNAEMDGRFAYVIDLGANSTFNQLKLTNGFNSSQHARYAEFAQMKIWSAGVCPTTIDDLEGNEVTLAYDYANKTETMYSVRDDKDNRHQAEIFNFATQTARYIVFEFYTFFRDSSAYLYSMASEAEVFYSPAMPETPGYDPDDEIYDELEIYGVSGPAVNGNMTRLLISMSHNFYSEANVSDLQAFSDYTSTQSSNAHGANHTEYVTDLAEKGATSAVDRLIEFDGKTFWQIRNETYEAKRDYFLNAVMVGNSGKTLEINFLNYDGDPDALLPFALTGDAVNRTHTLTIKKGFVTGEYAKLKEDVTFTYDPATKVWKSDKEGDLDVSKYETVDALDISGPIVTPATDPYILVSFKVTLSAAFFDTDLQYVGSPMEWIAANKFASQEVLDLFSSEGVYASMASLLLINGKSIATYRAEEQDGNFANVAVQVHTYGRTIEIVVPGVTNDGAAATNGFADIDREFTVEFKRGFLTGNLGMIKNNVKFTYDPAKQAWSRESAGVGSNIGTEAKYIGLNGFEITEGAVIEMLGVKELKKELFTVYLVDTVATWNVDVTELKAGDNAVKLTITGSDNSTREINFTVRAITKEALQVAAAPKKSGCGASAVGGMSAGFAFVCLAGAAVAVLCRAKKQNKSV